MIQTLVRTQQRHSKKTMEQEEFTKQRETKAI
jgi:hypothetical protein